MRRRAQASAVGLSMDTPTRVPLSFLSSPRDEEISLGVGIHVARPIGSQLRANHFVSMDS